VFLPAGSPDDVFCDIFSNEGLDTLVDVLCFVFVSSETGDGEGCRGGSDRETVWLEGYVQVSTMPVKDPSCIGENMSSDYRSAY
jgi:hypothetical protein